MSWRDSTKTTGRTVRKSASALFARVLLTGMLFPTFPVTCEDLFASPATTGLNCRLTSAADFQVTPGSERCVVAFLGAPLPWLTSRAAKITPRAGDVFEARSVTRTVEFEDGSSLTIMPKSRVVVAEHQPRQRYRLDLSYGSLRVRVGPGVALEVSTSLAACRVERGEVYILARSPDDTEVVNIAGGIALVSRAGDSSARVLRLPPGHVAYVRRSRGSIRSVPLTQRRLSELAR